MIIGEFSWVEFINSALPLYMTAFATIGLIFVAFIQSKKAIKETSERSAFEFLTAEFSRGEIKSELRKVIVQYPDSSVLTPESTSFDEVYDEDLVSNRDKLIIFLNHRELLAERIFAGDISKRVILNIVGTSIRGEWLYCSKFVLKLREETKYPDYYSSFEKLATEWVGN